MLGPSLQEQLDKPSQDSTESPKQTLPILDHDPSSQLILSDSPDRILSAPARPVPGCRVGITPTVLLHLSSISPPVSHQKQGDTVGLQQPNSASESFAMIMVPAGVVSRHLPSVNAAYPATWSWCHVSKISASCFDFDGSDSQAPASVLVFGPMAMSVWHVFLFLNRKRFSAGLILSGPGTMP